VTLAILVAPKFDEPTSYSYDWSREIKEMLEEKGFQVIDIGGRPLSRVEVEKALTENPNALFIFYNHGNEDCLWASQTEKAVDKDNVKLLASRECFTMACLSAKQLGVQAYKIGCLAYWGYTEVFAFTTEDANVFKEFANCGLKFKLEGKTWEEALQQAKNLAKELAQKLIEAGKYFSSILLQQDADALRCYTPNNPPTETKCIFRKIALKIFGPKLGWKISRTTGFGILLTLVGWGIVAHDFAHQVYQLKGTPLSLEGGYIGLALNLIGFILLTSEFINWLKH
jgi:hypothetical protein